MQKQDEQISNSHQNQLFSNSYLLQSVYIADSQFTSQIVALDYNDVKLTNRNTNQYQKIKKLHIVNTQLRNLQQVIKSQNKFPHLKIYKIHHNQHLARIPLIISKSIAQISIKHNSMKTCKKQKCMNLLNQDKLISKKMEKTNDVNFQNQIKQNQSTNSKVSQKHHSHKSLTTLYIHDSYYDLNKKQLPCIQKIHLSNISNLNQIKKQLFSSYPTILSNIKTLILPSNSIIQIWQQIYDINTLEYLDLHNNKIKSIRKQFNSQKILKQINLKNNKIQNIMKFLQGRYQQLKQLNLSHNKIIFQENSFIINAPKLQVLKIHDNKGIASQIQGKYPQLKQLNLSYTRVKQLQIMESKLQVLNLQHGSFKKLVEGNGISYKHIKRITAVLSFIRQISFVGTQHLEEVIFSRTGIKNMQEFFKCKIFVNLKRLILSFNYISNFNVQQCEFPQLRQLDLSCNQIRQISSLHAPKLQNLDLSRNNIQRIQYLFQGLQDQQTYQFPCLQFINLSNNSIQTLPSIIAPSLKYLNLYQNGLYSINQFAKKQYQNLIQLNLSYNKYRSQIKFEILPALKTPKLQILNLQMNQICDISCFAKGIYPQLKIINLKCNEISSLPQLKTPKLVQIHLGQKAKTISEFLKGKYPYLQKIHSSHSLKARFFPCDKPIIQNSQSLSSLQQKIILSSYQIQQICKQANQNFSIIKHKLTKSLHTAMSKQFFNLRQLQINEPHIKSLQFISFLDMRYIKKIFIQDKNYRNIYSNLHKINFNRYPKLTQIEIRYTGKRINVQHNVSYKPKNQNRIRQQFIQLYEQSSFWRRIYRKQNQILWIIRCGLAGSFQFLSFQNRLPGYQLNRIIKNL